MRRKVWIAGVGALVVLGALWGLHARGASKADKTADGGEATRKPGDGKGDQSRGENRPVSVVAGRVVQRDVAVYVDGLGSVTAFQTVTVHTRVDGQLNAVFFREGQAVKKGALLAQIDPRPFQAQLHQAQAARVRDAAQAKGAHLNLERYQAVRSQDLIAQQQVDDQRALVDQLEGVVATDDAQIESANLQLTYARITSPIDGVTGIRLVDAGNVVHASDATGIVIITQLDPIAILFTLPQDDLPRVSEFMKDTALTVTVYSRDGEKALGKGEVTLIDNQINASTATIRLKAIVPNPEHALWPNQFVKARLFLTTRKNALVVPAAAVQRGPNGPFVYRVEDDRKASVRAVQVESVQGEEALIASGLVSGETVVIDGQAQLRPGAALALQNGDGKAAPGGRALDGSGTRGGASGGRGDHARKSLP